MSQEQSHPQISMLGKDLEQNLEADPYSLFLFAMNSPETKEKYVTRLKKFFDFIGLKQNTMEERCKVFVDKSTVEPSTKYALNSIIRFLQMNKDRVQRKEITGATARNYVKTSYFFVGAEISHIMKAVTAAIINNTYTELSILNSNI